MKKPISSAYYGGIFFDFILHDRTADAAIILPNFPSHNSYEKLMKFWFDRGYHVFVPRYRGTYQSNGKFLGKNVAEDMIEFVRNFDKGYIKNLWDGKKKTFKVHKKILIAGGFSGAIACGMAAKSNLFSHLILASPIWDFSSHNSDGNEQDLAALIEFVSKSYKNCYRFSFKNLKRVLGKYKELHPNYYLPRLHDGNFPVLVFHDPNDKNVSFAKTKSVIERMPNVTLIEHYLGHGLSDDLFSVFWKDVDKFIKINYIESENKEKEKAKERKDRVDETISEEKELKKFEKAAKKVDEENEIKVIVEGEKAEKKEAP